MKLQALILIIISFFIFTYEIIIIGCSILISITLFFWLVNTKQAEWHSKQTYSKHGIKKLGTNNRFVVIVIGYKVDKQEKFRIELISTGGLGISIDPTSKGLPNVIASVTFKGRFSVQFI